MSEDDKIIEKMAECLFNLPYDYRHAGDASLSSFEMLRSHALNDRS